MSERAIHDERTDDEQTDEPTEERLDEPTDDRMERPPTGKPMDERADPRSDERTDDAQDVEQFSEPGELTTDRPDTARTPERAPTGGNGAQAEAIGADERRRFMERWQVIQAEFVDDPKGSAQHADALVSEVVSQVTERHRRLREEMGRHVQGGGETEAIRLALRDYRTFLRGLIGS